MLSKTFRPVVLLFGFCLVAVAVNGCGGESSQVDVDIISTVVSPDEEHVATVYNISGGGAAGYVYRLVGLRRHADTFNRKEGIVFQVTHTENITATWEDDAHLTIRYSKPSSLLTQVKEWGTGERKIHINYVEE